MGELIVLPRCERPARPASHAESSAEILFFTGVRYYRVAEQAPIETKTRRRRRIRVADVSGERRIDVHA